MKDLQKFKTVLVIDDDATIRETLRMFLEFEDFVVSCCEDGKSGLDLAKKRSFDVILVDYQMPGLKGDDTTRLLRALCPARLYYRDEHRKQRAGIYESRLRRLYP